MTALKLVERRSPERGALAEAIKRRRAAERHLAELDRARRRLDERMFGDDGLTERVDRASEALEEAKAGERKELVAAALGKKGATSVASARAAYDEAQRALDAARATVTALDAEKAEGDSELLWATQALERAVAAVVRSEPPRKLAQECLAHRRAFTDRIRALDYLARNGMLADELNRFRNLEEWPDLPGDKPWRAAVEALSGDADAALPE